jgi:hypothetical protein
METRRCKHGVEIRTTHYRWNEACHRCREEAEAFDRATAAAGARLTKEYRRGGHAGFGPGGSGGGAGVRQRRAKRTNKRADRRVRNLVAREAWEVRRSIRWVLANPLLTREHFTPLQWAALSTFWGPRIDGHRVFKAAMGRAWGMTSRQVTKALEAAEVIAYALCYCWNPARLRWHARMALPRDERPRQSDEDRYWLKHFADAKKGRRAAPGQPVELVAEEDLLDLDRKGRHDRSTTSLDMNWNQVGGSREDPDAVQL